MGKLDRMTKRKNQLEAGSNKTAPAATPASAGITKSNRKRKVMMVASRGVTHRYRHLMTDLLKMLPHSKKDAKVDLKEGVGSINEIADMENCDLSMLFEVRRKEDLYVWMSKAPNGPTIKFQCTNVHTQGELKLTGNCLKGSRPLISFDGSFKEEPHFRLVKEVLTQIFAVPRGNVKSKPFIDHIYQFSVVDGRIWFRNFQIVYPVNEKDPIEGIELVEIGPRFVLNPIRIFAGSFGGPTLYQNPSYQTPTELRRMAKQRLSGKYVSRKRTEARRKDHNEKFLPEADPLDDVFMHDD